MISLKQLHYALAVAKHLHFKKAADACHISQSTLSTAITELEKQLGVLLFERNNKYVLLTTQGKLILAKAKQVKLAVDELTSIAQSNNSPLSSPMSIGVIPTIGPYLLPKVLPEVRKQFPDFRLKIIEEQSQVLVDLVRTGELDAAILALPYPLEGLLAFNFWQEDFYMVAHKDDYLNRQGEITTEQLDLNKLMLLKDGHCLKDHALAACHLQNFQANADVNATSLHTLIQMVAGKLGTTLVPEMALDQLIYQGSELRSIHLNEPGPHRKLAFIVRPNFTRVNDINLLQEIFTRQLNKFTHH